MISGTTLRVPRTRIGMFGSMFGSPYLWTQFFGVQGLFRVQGSGTLGTLGFEK